MRETFRATKDGHATRELTFRKLRDRREAILVAELSGARTSDAVLRRADRLMDMPDLLLAVDVTDRDAFPVAMVTHTVTYARGSHEDAVSLAWEVFENDRRAGIGTAVAVAALGRHFDNAMMEATVSVDPTDAVATRHLERLGFRTDEQDAAPASLRGPVSVTYTLGREAYVQARRAAVAALPRTERDERCALSGLPIVAGTEVAMAIAYHPRLRTSDDIDWKPGLPPEEEMVGHVFRGEYDGSGWTTTAGRGRGRDETEKAVASALAPVRLSDWLRPDRTSDIEFLGHLMRNAEAGGPVPPVGAVMVRRDVLEAFVPHRGQPDTPEQASEDFKAALRAVGVPLAPTVRGGRPGIEWDAVARMRDIARELADDGPAPSP